MLVKKESALHDAIKKVELQIETIAKKIIELFEKLERTFQLNSMYKIVENEFAKKLAYECKNLPISAFQKSRQEKKCT